MRHVLWVAALAACGSETTTRVSGVSDSDGSLVVVDGLSGAISRPNPEVAALTYELVTTSDVPSTLRATWTNGDHTVTANFDTPAVEHRHLLLGWRPDSDYTVEVVATSAMGIDTPPLVFDIETDPLPDHFPSVQVWADPSADIQPGHTLAGIRTPPKGGTPEPRGVGVVFDEEGHIVWTLDLQGIAEDIRNLDNTTVHAMIGVDGEANIVHFDWAGQRLQTWSMGPASEGITGVPKSYNEQLFHHDMSPIVGTNEFIGITRRPLIVDSYPADDTYGSPDITQSNVTIADDVLVRFDAAGSVLDEVSLAAIMDTTRIGYDSLETVTQGWLDWAHANAIDEYEGDYIVSLRHQDAVVRVDPTVPEIKWILGNPHGWAPDDQPRLLTPIGAPFHWNYHQHAPMVRAGSTADALTLIVFDNGNWRASPFDGTVRSEPEESASRIVEFTINETTMEVSQNWSWSTADSTLVPGIADLFSAAVGDADYLANGNVLGTWGFLNQTADGTFNEAAGLGEKSVRIVEFVPGGSDVWHLALSTTADQNANGWTVYRSDRIESLYGRVVD